MANSSDLRRQMLAGTTHSKSGLNDGYFGKFKRLYEGEDKPLWQNRRWVKMRQERLEREKYNITYGKNPKKCCIPDSWYGTFGPHLERFDPKQRKVTKEPPLRNFITSKPVVKFPKYIPEEGKFPEDSEFEMNGSCYFTVQIDPNAVDESSSQLDLPLKPPFITATRTNSLFDRNPNKADKIEKTYIEYFDPRDSLNHKFGIYNNYATKANNCFACFPKHEEDPYEKPKTGFNKAPQKRTTRFGPYVPYAGQNRSKWDKTNPFSPYPPYLTSPYVDQWKIDRDFSKRIKYVKPTAKPKKITQKSPSKN